MRSKVEATLEHIGHVQEKTKKMGLKLIDQGEHHLGINLIKNGLIHDQSKLQGIELEYLHNEYEGEKPPGFFLAWRQHVTTNNHHPEAWGGIQNMPRVFLAELTCDWSARSNEKDECFDDFLHNIALDKFKFSKDSDVYKNIVEFKTLIVEKKWT